MIAVSLLCYFAVSKAYVNPVEKTCDCPDPGAVYGNDGTYYVATTGGSGGSSFPIRSSPDLITWRQIGYIFPSGQAPSWSNQNYWAPELHRVNNSAYNAYFTSNDRTNGNLLSVGVATSSTPHGPFRDPIGSALVKGDASTGIGYIDPNFFQDPNTNTNYILFKYDGNSKGVATPIYIQQLDSSGTRLLGSKKQLITDDQKWEHTNNGQGTGCIEAPWMIYRAPYYYLFYSGSMYNTQSYNIGVARSKDLLNQPFVKLNGPILHTRMGDPYIMDVTHTFNGPGHCSVLSQRNDNTNFVMLYHSWKTVGSGGRFLMLDPIQWVNGWPRILSDTPSQDDTNLNMYNE